MNKPKSNPVVIRFKKWKTLIHAEKPKKGPEPCHKGSKQEGPPAKRRDVDPENHRMVWIGTFGNRLRIDAEKGFFLDDRPISLNDLMKKTNRIRRANGLELIGRNPAWF